MGQLARSPQQLWVTRMIHLEVLQLAFQRIVRPGKGLEDVPESVLAAALGCRDVIKVILEGRNLLLTQGHAFLEPEAYQGHSHT